MFSGIIAELGHIGAIISEGGIGWHVTIISSPGADRKIGASVACSGICLTVIACDARGFSVQISSETLACTTASGWREGSPINLEPSLCLGDPVDGHLVSGHVDARIKVHSLAQDGEYLRVGFTLPGKWGRLVAQKGSVAIDGVSLTINELYDQGDCTFFFIHLIPHTLAVTTLGLLSEGSEVNFEADLIARYLERLAGEK